MKAGWRGMRMALAAMTLFSVLLAIYARELASFMIDDETTIGLTVTFIYIIAIAQPIMAVDITLSGALRGAGDTRFPLLATVLASFSGACCPPSPSWHWACPSRQSLPSCCSTTSSSPACCYRGIDQANGWA